MDLQQTLQTRLNTLFRGFLQNIADHYKIDYEELCKFVDSVDLKDGGVQSSMTCMVRITRGKNKGQYCTGKALENGYCSKHQNSASATIGSIIEKTGKKTVAKKGMTKTQMQIIEWLNTAVPQDEVVLKKRSKGLLHEESDIIFNDSYVVIGRVNNGKIVKLSNFEVELCEKRGWQYDEDAVEIESDSE